MSDEFDFDDPRLYEMFDTIDAAILSGDRFLLQKNRTAARAFFQRWERALNEYDSMQNEAIS